jgi:hypothetical protein
MPLAPNNSTTKKTATHPNRAPAPSTESCCRLMSFERPNYFAGHLLTDADLLLEQRYVREKRKLYHRSLHGSGVVCGLRLTCNHNCAGNIFVGSGYAIDDCGNDLVLPEGRALDVVSLLIQKGLIVPEATLDPCYPKTPESECNFRQCFYITICYVENQVDFATPLVATCQTTSSECEPTRILETVSFNVVDTPPGVQPDQDALLCRLESCFKLFSDGAFAQALHRHQRMLSEIITFPAETDNDAGGHPEHHAEYDKLFCELRGLLLLYLSKHPDKYNCTIEDQIRRVRFPEVHRRFEHSQATYLEELRTSFSSLLALAWQYAVNCALGEFVPTCAQVCEASCVLLGAVVVENGRIVRVCNCPRKYVWSAANFREVLLASTLGELACEKEHGDDRDKAEANDARAICCRDFDFDVECFLQWLKVSPKAPLYAGTELLRWMETFRKSIQEGFDFTDPCNFSPRIFEKLDENKATEILRTAKIQFRTTEAPLDNKAPDLFSLLQSAGLATLEKPIQLAVKEASVASATLENQELLAHINYLYSQIGDIKLKLERIRPQSS